MIFGTVGDHLSTMVALTSPHTYETNPFAQQLMAIGLWEAVDLIMIALGIVTPYFLIRRSRRMPLKGILAYPIIFGAVRLAACIWNLSLL